MKIPRHFQLPIFKRETVTVHVISILWKCGNKVYHAFEPKRDNCKLKHATVEISLPLSFEFEPTIFSCPSPAFGTVVCADAMAGKLRYFHPSIEYSVEYDVRRNTLLVKNYDFDQSKLRRVIEDFIILLTTIAFTKKSREHDIAKGNRQNHMGTFNSRD